MNPIRSAPRAPKLRTVLSALALALLLAGCGGGDADKDAKDGKADAADKTAEAARKDGEVDKDGKKKNEEKPVPVEVAQVAKRPIQASYHGTAALEAPNEAQVVAKTSGVLLQLLAEEGDAVKAGQVLARIDPDRPRLEVQRAEAMLKKLQAEMARSKELFERKLIAADVFERIRFDVATQQAAYDMARLELSYTNIVAPIDGVVAQRMVKQGNLIQLNTALFRIVDVRELDAVLNVPEKELATLSAGLAATMEVDALPGQPFAGAIDRVSPVVDAGSGTFRVVVRFQSKGVLKPGMFGRVGIVHSQRSDALTIPRTALLEDAGESAVFAVREGAAVRVPIQLGYVNGELAEIRAGLAEGESVVTAGKVTLRDGSKVEVLNAPPKSDPAAVVAETAAVAQAADKN
jgi:membrane fusion protein (multidrug efflux system)